MSGNSGIDTSLHAICWTTQSQRSPVPTIGFWMSKRPYVHELQDGFCYSLRIATFRVGHTRQKLLSEKFQSIGDDLPKPVA